MKQGLVRLLYNFGKRFMGWTLHMIICVLLCYPVSIHMSQLLSTGRPISSFIYKIHREKYKLHRENTGNLNWKMEWEPCVNTSYPMDNCFTGRDQSRQTPEKDVLYILPAGLVTECAFARWRIVLPSCLDSVTS